jgi:hypothetical protein
MPTTTWNRSRDGDFQAEVDVDVDIDGRIHDVFTTADMLHDEGRRELDTIGANGEPMVHTIQEHPQSLGNANNDFATRVGNEGSNHESEAEELEEDTKIMAEAFKEPKFGPDHSMFDEASRVPLYEGAALFGLAATLFILNCCRTHGTSNAFINEMLHLLKMSILPQPNTLPSNEYKTSNILKKLGLAYNIIHACPKGHMVFCGQYENDQNCPQCELARYKLVGKSLVPQKNL